MEDGRYKKKGEKILISSSIGQKFQRLFKISFRIINGNKINSIVITLVLVP